MEAHSKPAANPMVASFQHFAGGAPNERMDSFDWNSHGISIPYVIFFAGRCGSTLLTRLLKSSGLCGLPDEFFNDTAFYNRSIKANTFPEYFSGLVREHSSHGRFGFEIDPIRFASLRQLLNFTGIFPPEITSLFWMTRRNIVAQAWSFAKAKVSGVWHLDQWGLVPDAVDSGIVTDRDVWREIALVLRGEQSMEAFFSEYDLKPCRIDYEMLVADKNATMIKVLRHLECPVTGVIEFLAHNAKETERQTYSDRDKFIALFFDKYRSKLDEIERERNSIDVGKLKTWLKTEHNILP